MNKIYKSIYNATRRCMVCVSEIQSSKIKTKSESKGTPVKPILSMLSAAVLMAVSSCALALPEPDSIVIGGIYYSCDGGSCRPNGAGGASNWNYTFSGAWGSSILNMAATDKTLYKSLADTTSGNLVINNGYTVNIRGGQSFAAHAFKTLASSTGVATISNNGSLLIQGGLVSGAHGVDSTSSSTTSIGNILNSSEASMSIQGGSVVGASGINSNASSDGATAYIINDGELNVIGNKGTAINVNGDNGGNGYIRNQGVGILVIQGGDVGDGIGYNATKAGKGTITNEDQGTLKILGGELSENSYGLYFNATDQHSIGKIENNASGDVLISGKISSAIFSNASDEAQGFIQNNGDGTITIQGGDGINVYGIEYNAIGSGSIGTISNIGKGNLIIKAGTKWGTSGILINGHDYGHGIITNEGIGQLIISGSAYEGSGSRETPGISSNAGLRGTGEILNKNMGTLVIQGGTGGYSYGIATNAGQQASGTISNIGAGDLIIKGGSGSHASGIDVNAQYSQSNGIISNIGEGTLTIEGGMYFYAYGIRSNASSGGLGIVSNEGNGRIEILTAEAGLESAVGSNAEDAGSSGKITNLGLGTILIQGSVDYPAIDTNATDQAEAIINNTGKGSLIIVRGVGVNAKNGAKATISNTTSGIITIQSFSENGEILGHGINIASRDNNSQSFILNGQEGTLNIFGSNDQNYGINNFVSFGASSVLENAGIMNLNRYAIGKFASSVNFDSISVVNKATGIVNSEAEAIFEYGNIQTEVNDPIPITIYTPNEGTKVTELDSYANSEITVTTGWKLKDDWYNYSTWEDGGKLVITDVVAGSEQANQIQKAFQSRFGTGTTIEFTGTEVNTTSLNRDASEKPVFSMWHVDELIANGEIKNGSVVTSEVLNMTVSDDFGIPDLPEVLSEVNYDPGEYSLVVGDTGEGNLHEYTVSQDIGFKGLVANGDVIVKDGYSFTLLGEQAAMAMALRTTESQATFKLTDSPVTVQADSTLKLGVADLSATQGYFEDLAMTDGSAALSVENGIFQITNVTGNGQINVQEKGQLTIANKASAGDVVNKGVLTANTVNTQIGGTASVATMADGDQNHFETFTNEKGAEANFADVSITEGANVRNKAEGTINAGAVVLNGGAVITNFKDGTLNFDTFEMNGTLRNNGTINVTSEMTLAEGTSTTLAGKVTAGTLSIGRAAQKALPASIALMTEPQTSAEITGETYSAVLDLAGGNVFIRKDAILAGVELKDNIVNSHVTVDTDGTFAFSYNENQLESALKDLKLDTEGKALAVLSTDLSFGETGSLTIGTTDATDTVNLGSDALVLLGTDSLHGNAVLNGEGKETINIKEGAQLAFTDESIWGNHYLIRDFVSMDAAENLTVKDLEGNILETHYNDKGIYVTIGSTDILDKDANFGLSNNINAIMDGRQDTTSEFVDIRYLSQAMGAKDGVKQTNDLQHLSAQAGILSEAYRLTDNAHESIIRHAMSDKYSNVWVEALAGKGGVDGAGTGYGDASYDSDSYGMIFGLDGRIGESINVGAAIHYQKGDLDADSSQTKNEFKNYGASIYAGTNVGKLNVTAGIMYAKGDHEFNQVNLGYVEGETDTEVFMGGVRASYPILLDRILITPYAGIEAVHVKEDGFNAKIGGSNAFDFGSVSETFGRVPMGVKLSGGNAKFAGYADISVIPQFGNRDAKQTVSGVTTKAADVAKFDYADSVLGRVKMGAAYQVTPSTTLGISYGASMGDMRDLSHEFSLNAKYRF